MGLNTVLTFRRRPRVVEPLEELSLLNVAIPESSHEESEALYLAIRELGEIDRMVITLHLDGYENDEIADITGFTKNHVAVKLHRVKESIMKKLKAI